MSNQKGQIHVIVLILIVVGFVLYANFSDKSLLKWFFPSTYTPSASKATNQDSRITPPLITTPIQSVFVPEPADATPPRRSNSQPTGSLPAETRKITLSLETDEKATCRYSDVTSGIHYDSMQGSFSQTGGTLHSVLLTTLSEGGNYKYYIKCSDEKGNKNTDDFVISFGVKLPEDKTPPVRSNPSHQGDILPAGATSAVISISTDEPASCSYSGSMSGSFSYYDQTKKFHTKNITGLEDGKTYDFFVRCQDFAGNSNTGDVLINFSVKIIK